MLLGIVLVSIADMSYWYRPPRRHFRTVVPAHGTAFGNEPGAFADGYGGGWGADYPWADINLSLRLGELTRTTVSRDAIGDPKPLIIRLSDPTIYQCGFVMMTEVGAIALSEEEAVNLRTYLLKGGFLWVDDFWGTYAWNYWVDQIRKVFPAAEYPIVDVPPDHAL